MDEKDTVMAEYEASEKEFLDNHPIGQLIRRLGRAELIFYNGAIYRSASYWPTRSAFNPQTTHEKETNVNMLVAMPVIGEAIGIVESIPQNQIIDLVKEYTVLSDVLMPVLSMEGVCGFRLRQDIKSTYLRYLKREFSLENCDNPFYRLESNNLELIAKTCGSAKLICNSPSLFRLLI